MNRVNQNQPECPLELSNEGKDVYWKRIDCYKCLLCEDKIFTGPHAIQDRDVHMYNVHRPFNDLFGACEKCGLTYVDPYKKKEHERRKKDGYNCNEEFEKEAEKNLKTRVKDLDDDIFADDDIDEHPPLVDLSKMSPAEKIKFLFGDRKYKCKCGYNTNDEQCFKNHVKKLRFKGERIITLKNHPLFSESL